MKIKVTTETGSYYHIDTDRRVWSKNHYDHHHMIGFWRAGSYEDRTLALANKGTWHDIDFPEVGKCMYIHGRGINDWYISTEVVSIEEDPEDWDVRLDGVN